MSLVLSEPVSYTGVTGRPTTIIEVELSSWMEILFSVSFANNDYYMSNAYTLAVIVPNYFPE